MDRPTVDSVRQFVTTVKREVIWPGNVAVPDSPDRIEDGQGTQHTCCKIMMMTMKRNILTCFTILMMRRE